MQADITGEPALAKKEWAQSLKAYWGARVMRSTTIDGGCYTVAYATSVAASIDCLCLPAYGCECPDITADCVIPFDAEAIPVSCNTLVDAYVFTGAGEEDINGVFVPSDYIPEAVFGTTVYAYNGYTVYVSELLGTWTADLVIGTSLYTAASITGIWSADTGTEPVPVVTRARLTNLCDTDLSPEERIAMALPDAEPGLYFMDCCGVPELFVGSQILNT